MKSFMWVPINSGNRSGSGSENCGFRIAQVLGCHSENGVSYTKNGISNSESCSEKTPELSESSEKTPELSESSENGLFHSESVFPEIGVVPGFREIAHKKLHKNCLGINCVITTSRHWWVLENCATQPLPMTQDNYWRVVFQLRSQTLYKKRSCNDTLFSQNSEHFLATSMRSRRDSRESPFFPAILEVLKSLGVLLPRLFVAENAFGKVP